jgi:hypothetical protein
MGAHTETATLAGRAPAVLRMKCIIPRQAGAPLPASVSLATWLRTNAIRRGQVLRPIAMPWDEMELRLAIQRAFSHRALTLENQRLADLVRVQQG